MVESSWFQALLKTTLQELPQRVALLGLSSEDREALSSFAKSYQGSAQFIDRLYLRFQQDPALSLFLSNPTQVQKLKRVQQAYLDELLSNALDKKYVEKRLRIGLIHHQVRLSPQWYISTYTHFAIEHLPLLWAHASTTEEACTLYRAFLKAILLDASMVLDAYGMSLETSLKEQRPLSSEHALKTANLGKPSQAEPPAISPPSFTRLRLTPDELEHRLHFIGVSELTQQELRKLHPVLQTRLFEIIDSFYEKISQIPALQDTFSLQNLPRLKKMVFSYWQEFASTQFDRPYAASRLRIGLVHERVGLSPQWYLAGIGHQFDLLMLALQQEGLFQPELVRACTQTLFLDISFSIDSYMEARAERVLRTDGYAAQLIDGLTAGIAIVDQHLRVLSTNPYFLDIVGLEPSLVQNMALLNVLPIADLPASIQQVWSHQTHRVVLFGKLGQRTFRIAVVEIQDKTLKPEEKRAAVVVDEISSLLQVSEEFRLIGQDFTSLTQSIEGIVWEADANSWTIEMISSPALHLTGFRDFFFLGRAKAWLHQIPEPDRTLFLQACKRLQPGDSLTQEHRFLRADQSTIWLQTNVKCILAPDGTKRLRGLSTDVTQSVQTRQSLDERLSDQAVLTSLTRKANLANTSKELFEALVQAGSCLQGTLGALVVTQQISGNISAVASSETHPLLEKLSDPTILTQLFRHAPLFAKARALPPELHHLSQDFESTDGLIVTPLQWRQQKPGLFIILLAQNSTWSLKRAAILETFANIVALAYQQRLQEIQQQDKQRLELLGTIASGIVHDLNNILTGVSVSAELLSAAHTLPPHLEGTPKLLHEAAENGQALISDILSFVRPFHEESQTPACNVETTLDGTQRLARALLPDTITLHTDFQSHAISAIAPRHLQQIAINLIVNASQALTNKGEICVSTRDVNVKEAQQVHTGPLSPREYVCFEVEDNGMGIAEEHIPHLFEPFFTTKEENGTGMGLAIIHQLVSEVGGQIELFTRPNQGTRFSIYLPKISSLPRSTQPELQTLVPPKETSVLLVDDEPAIQQAIGLFLERQGYQVLRAKDGKAAFALLQKDQSIAAIITDQNMPEMSGVELAQHVFQEIAEIPILLCSGLPIQLPPDLEGRPITMINKPFYPKNLLQQLTLSIQAHPRREKNHL
ncbi:MAG: response regulator [Myxococcales bacterium]|nr:response regulator [Myxococcales bacterium]